MASLNRKLTPRLALFSTLSILFYAVLVCYSLDFELLPSIHGCLSPRNLLALRSPERACPSNVSARAALPHNRPSSPLAFSEDTSWYVTVRRNFSTDKPPV